MTLGLGVILAGLLVLALVGLGATASATAPAAATTGTATSPGSSSSTPPSGPQKQQIAQVAQQYGLSPQTLWGIYGTESDFGHDPSTSSAGAEGPFQFIPSTWATYGSGDIQNFSDSLVAAAKLLRSLGANSDPTSSATVAAANQYNGNGGGHNALTSYFQKVLSLGKTF